jgi:hypothetical protein
MKLRTVRGELFAGMVVLIVGFTVVSLFSIHHAIRRIARGEVEARVAQSRVAFTRFAALEDRLGASTVVSLAEVPYFKALVGLPEIDRATLDDALKSCSRSATAISWRCSTRAAA